MKIVAQLPTKEIVNYFLLNIYSGNDDSDNNTYINKSEDKDLDKLQAYLSKKRQSKQVSNNINKYVYMNITNYIIDFAFSLLGAK